MSDSFEQQKIDLARTLLQQICEEGAQIADYAREHQPESWRNVTGQLQRIAEDLGAIRKEIGCEEDEA